MLKKKLSLNYEETTKLKNDFLEFYKECREESI